MEAKGVGMIQITVGATGGLPASVGLSTGGQAASGTRQTRPRPSLRSGRATLRNSSCPEVPFDGTIPGQGPERKAHGEVGMKETILDTVGRTPLVRLRRLTEGLQAGFYVKLESLNPGGSVKDRVGLAMITEAERRGWL